MCADNFPFFPFIQDVYDLKKTSLQMDTIKQMHFFMQIKKHLFLSISIDFKHFVTFCKCLSSNSVSIFKLYM